MQHPGKKQRQKEKSRKPKKKYESGNHLFPPIALKVNKPEPKFLQKLIYKSGAQPAPKGWANHAT